MKLSSLSIIIPSYNNAKTIGIVIEEAVFEAKKFTDDFEIIVLDDGSPDDSLSLLEKISQKNKNIKLVRHKKNLGFGRTIKELYNIAQKDYIFSLPGDRQIKADILNRLFLGFKKYDLVIGVRTVRNDSFLRRIQSIIYNKLLKFLFRLEIHDVNSSKLIKKEIIKAVNLKSDSPFVDGELCISAKRLGYKIGEVDIEHYKDKTGQSGGGSLKTIGSTLIDLVLYFFYKLWANDFLFYGFLIVFIIFLGQLPIILHVLHTPKDFYYPLLDKVATSDYYYLALIRYGMGGEWLLQIPYVIAPHKASLIQIFYVLLGKISLATGLGPAETFALFRVLGGLLLAVAAAFLLRILLSKNHARLVFVFFLLAQPWPIFRGYLSSLWLQEFNKWIWHFGEAARRISTAPPHYTMGKGLMILSLVFLLHHLKKRLVSGPFTSEESWRARQLAGLPATIRGVFIADLGGVFAALLIFLAGIIYPPPVFILVFSLVVSCIVYIFARGPLAVLQEVLFKKSIIFYLFAAILPLLILKFELSKGYPWDGWNRVELGWNERSMKFEWEYIHMLGVLILVVPIAVLSILKKGISSLSNLGYLRVFIFVWFLSSFLLFPFADILKLGKFRFTEGVQILPLSILALWGFNMLSKKFKVVFFTFFILNALYFTALSSQWSTKSLWGYWTNVYFRPEEVSALKYLDKFVEDDAVVLSDAQSSNFIPAFTRVKTIIGFSDAYPEYKMFEAEEKKIQNILLGRAKIGEASDYLKEKNVKYIYVDKSLYGANVYPLFYKSIFKNKLFEIYKVESEEIFN